MNALAKGTPVPSRALCRLLMLDKQYDDMGWRGVHDTPVDECIYTVNRQFRMLGNQKPNTPCLRLVKFDDSFRFLHGPDDNRGCAAELQKATVGGFLKCLIGRPAYQGKPVFLNVSASEAFPFAIQVSRAFTGIYGGTSQQQSCALVTLAYPHKETRITGRLSPRRPKSQQKNRIT